MENIQNEPVPSSGFFGDDPLKLLKAYFVWHFTFCQNQKAIRIILAYTGWQFANVLAVFGLCAGFVAWLIIEAMCKFSPEGEHVFIFITNVWGGGLAFYIAAVMIYHVMIPLSFDPNWKER